MFEPREIPQEKTSSSVKKVELLQKLTRQGAVLLRHGAKHDIYMQPKTNKEATVPRHDEINEFTAKAILKKLS